jgi:PGDYG protein
VLELNAVDLRTDPAAARYVKHEIVGVEFAASAGALISRVGPNHYQAGDALVSGMDGDRWCVSRDRFDLKYEPLPGVNHGQSGRYQNKPAPVLARQMTEPFRCQRTAGGDWLLQYAPGDHGVAAQARFAQVYRPLPGR